MYTLLLCMYPCVQVWKTSTSEFVRTLLGHRRGIACLQYIGQYVVSGSSDNTIRCVCGGGVLVCVCVCVWVCRCVCVQVWFVYRSCIHCIHLFISGWLCRIWDIECGACLRLLEGHDELVRCIRFDGKRIVSGAYDGYVTIHLMCSVCMCVCVCVCVCVFVVLCHCHRLTS